MRRVRWGGCQQLTSGRQEAEAGSSSPKRLRAVASASCWFRPHMSLTSVMLWQQQNWTLSAWGAAQRSCLARHQLACGSLGQVVRKWKVYSAST